jgi:hypothetical protein
VDQELLLRNEYLAAENRILKAKLKGRVRFSDAERARLGEIGHRLGRKVLGEVATVARPDTILAWYRKLVARKFDGSKVRRLPGRPRVDQALEQLIVRRAKENLDWGYDRIVGALANLGHAISDQTVAASSRRAFPRCLRHSRKWWPVTLPRRGLPRRRSDIGCRPAGWRPHARPMWKRSHISGRDSQASTIFGPALHARDGNCRCNWPSAARSLPRKASLRARRRRLISVARS